MAISLHTQTGAPNTSAATSVSPLEQSGSSKTKSSKNSTDIYQSVTTVSLRPWKPVLSRGHAHGSAYRACQDYLQIMRLALHTAG